MTQIRNWATALECYQIDHGVFPLLTTLQIPHAAAVSGPDPFFSAAHFSQLVTAWPVPTYHRLELLRRYLSPAYIADDADSSDGWDRPLLVAFTEDGQGLTLLSRGSDGEIDAHHELGSYPREQHWRDLVWVTECEAAGYAYVPAGITW